MKLIARNLWKQFFEGGQKFSMLFFVCMQKIVGNQHHKMAEKWKYSGSERNRAKEGKIERWSRMQKRWEMGEIEMKKDACIKWKMSELRIYIWICGVACTKVYVYNGIQWELYFTRCTKASVRIKFMTVHGLN